MYKQQPPGGVPDRFQQPDFHMVAVGHHVWRHPVSGAGQPHFASQ